MYEIAIIGGGPAGLAAAINAQRRNKQTVLISKETYSSKLLQAHKVENYLGLPGISGKELITRMQQHAQSLGIVFNKDEIQNIAGDSNKFVLFGRENMFEAATVILAVGITPDGEINGESAFTGRGVSYCATCDGLFFKNKIVAVIGYIPATEEAEFLAEICAKVYFIPQYKFEEKVDLRITVLTGKPLSINGRDKVERLQLTSGEWKVDGVFIEKAGRPVNQLLDGLKIDNGFITTDVNQFTNIPGVYAAGDCTGRPWQINRAVGQGQVAALSAVQYLEVLKAI
jgi:thioredoxin reductase (NADPH)